MFGHLLYLYNRKKRMTTPVETATTDTDTPPSWWPTIIIMGSMCVLVCILGLVFYDDIIVMYRRRKPTGMRLETIKS